MATTPIRRAAVRGGHSFCASGIGFIVGRNPTTIYGTVTLAYFMHGDGRWEVGGALYRRGLQAGRVNDGGSRHLRGSSTRRRLRPLLSFAASNAAALALYHAGILSGKCGAH